MIQFLRRFLDARRGSAAVLFGIGAVVVVGIGVAAINITGAVNQRSQVQDALDAAALGSVKLLAVQGSTDDQVKDAARKILAASTQYPDIVDSTVTVDRGQSLVTVSYSKAAANTLATPLWNGALDLKVKSKAKLGGTAEYPVCILIVEPYDSHTLRASGGSKLDLNNCLVQVNTANWDAVEAQVGQSYIHINGGQNCYVGDIHFGDVQPEKMPTCNLFADPFKNYSVGTHNHCDQTDFIISNNHPHAAPLDPGVYCGGIELQQDATFNPGVYYIKDGPLKVKGSQVDIHAEGVTFILMGDDAGLDIQSGGKMWFSPAANAGQFDGFVFYLDQSLATDPSAKSQITGADVTMSGTVYLAGQQLIIGKNADVTINPGAMVVSYLLGQGGDLNFTGSLDSSAAQAALRKSLPSTTPVLVE